MPAHSRQARQVVHRVQQRAAEFLADHRRRVQQALGGIRQAINLRRQYRAYVARYDEVIERSRQLIVARLSRQTAGFDQLMEHLFGVEWITRGSGDDAFSQCCY